MTTNLIQAVVDAAEAVCRRWESPDWKDMRHTADYIAALRAAVQGLREVGQPAPTGWLRSGDGYAAVFVEQAEPPQPLTREEAVIAGWRPLYADPPVPRDRYELKA
ncbi:hypothetical protein UFOVP703_72 [uncultured Caudovirales phage]|uniref:Uncharacterized protein n=1 Tax=uncultured Caudovirales phage TaxID=2100421 RepID=A0A6J5NPE2_9CAUD|nr:hypothetical protein UFOVP703_72 [uncultured Caudovirales phage]